MACGQSAVGRTRDRERFHRRVAERIARGHCPRCGKQPPAPGRKLCGPFAGKRRAAERARYAAARAAGKPCGGRDAESRLSFDQVEVLSDVSPMQRFTAWSWPPPGAGGRAVRSATGICAGAVAMAALSRTPAREPEPGERRASARWKRGRRAPPPPRAATPQETATMFNFNSDYDPVAPSAGDLLAALDLDVHAIRDALADDRARRYPRPRGPAGPEVERCE